MWQEAVDGRMRRPDLRNLDIYGDIGAELDRDDVEMGSVVDYREQYLEELAKRDGFAAIRPDARLWRGAA